jgi:hypothetical protein
MLDEGGSCAGSERLHAREESKDDSRWGPARVPGSVLADLLAAGSCPTRTSGEPAEWVAYLREQSTLGCRRHVETVVASVQMGQ